jgi:hypothetical protein
MKKYQSHKIVEAAPIIGYTALGNYVNVEADNDDGYERIAVPGDFFARGNPDLGDYLVRYQPDGYLSWSPKAVFEAGYTELTGDHPGFGHPLVNVTVKDGMISGISTIAPQPPAELAQAGRGAPDWSGDFKPATVEVTVTAPAGKRAEVAIGVAEGVNKWTVSGGQSQTWAVVGDESLIVCEGKPHSNVEQIFSPD